MPEVKPWFATELYPDDNDESIGIAGNFKVLTLDQLEAWLKDMRSPLCNFRPTPQANRIAIGVYGDLIAQVQAWKATHTRSER